MANVHSRINTKLDSKLAKAQQLAASGQVGEALQLLDKLCQKYKRNADAWFTQGVIYGKIGDFDKSIKYLQRAISLRPDHTLSYFNLGNAYAANGRPTDAISTYEKAIKLDNDNPMLWRALARAFVNTGRPRDAIKAYCQYLLFQPDDVDALGNLAGCYFHTGELEAAEKTYRKALRIKSAVVLMDALGVTLCQQGRIEEAIDIQREALRLEPDNKKCHSNLLLELNYLPDLPPSELLNEHKKWGHGQVELICQTKTFTQSPIPDRRLRIGYVSPDFRTHSVAYFLAPLLENHDQDSVEIWCYATSPQQDETTRHFRKIANHWRDISILNDSQVIELVRSDDIDILVDLAGHTAGNRLAVFAGKPAPIQVSWLGYPASTGLSTIDYRITDGMADPDSFDSFYTEELIRLPGCFLCYEPFSDCPPVMPPPVLENDHVTFGSFNNLAKINEAVISLWADLLHKVPDSRLLIKNPSLSDRATSERYGKLFESHGISIERINLVGLVPTTKDHLATYHRVDIALDTFPYNGTTTTCEALYMGVPVVTLTGQSHAGCVGASLLSTMKLEELITASKEEYVSKAIALSNNLDLLSQWRKTLRSQMNNSTLFDGKAFAYKMEEAYRGIWKKWCDEHVDSNVGS